MTQINIVVVHPETGEREQVSLPDDKLVSLLGPEIAERLGLSSIDYDLALEVSGQVLRGDQTLWEAGLREGVPITLVTPKRGSRLLGTTGLVVFLLAAAIAGIGMVLWALMGDDGDGSPASPAGTTETASPGSDPAAGASESPSETPTGDPATPSPPSSPTGTTPTPSPRATAPTATSSTREMTATSETTGTPAVSPTALPSASGTVPAAATAPPTAAATATAPIPTATSVSILPPTAVPTATSPPPPTATPTATPIPGTRIAFTTLPNGSATPLELPLTGQEWASLGITLAGTPEDDYCAGATAVVVTEAYGRGPRLSTSLPGNARSCNGVILEIRFAAPAQKLSLTFDGASVGYVLKAFDASGVFLGQATRNATFGGGLETITFVTPSPVISRVTFGHTKSLTTITEIVYE